MLRVAEEVAIQKQLLLDVQIAWHSREHEDFWNIRKFILDDHR